MNTEALNGKVLGTCTLQQVIGRGGMGAVFLAQQVRPRRQVAVKVLLPITPLSSQKLAAFLERFRRETDAAASLEHPNIVPVHEYGESDGLAYLVMPYIGGGTLRDEMEKGQQLPFSATMSYLEQIAAALDFAHERGVIHRDVKPANILLTPEKRALLTDFGLVKILGGEHEAQNSNPLSQAGMPMGTPDYMAPEQVVGQHIDGRADIYSLGVILYQMVTGVLPFKGEMPMQVAFQHLRIPPPSPRTLRPDLPVAAEQVMLRALAKRPEDRYEYARDFTNAFRLALEAAGVPLDQTFHATVTAYLNKQKLSATTALPEEVPARVPTESVASTVQEQPRRFSTAVSNKVQKGIVAQTSLTFPSLSGFLAPTHRPTSSLLEQSPAIPTKHTPLPAVNTMKNLPENNAFPLNGQFSPSPADRPTGGSAGENTSQLAPNRLRIGRKTNFLGDKPGSQSQMPEMNGGSSVQPQPSVSSTTSNGTEGTGLLGRTPRLNRLSNNTSQQQQQSTSISGSQQPFPDNSAQAAFSGTAFPLPNNSSPSGIYGMPAPVPGFTPQRSVTGSLQGDSAQSQAGNVPPFLAQNSTTTGSYSGFTYPPQAGMQSMPGVSGVSGTQTGALTGSLTSPGNSTGALMVIPPNESTGQTGMLKLTQAARVVKVPVAGQPGQYVTGLLPLLPSGTDTSSTGETTLKKGTKKNLKLLLVVLTIFVIIASSLSYFLTRSPGKTTQQTQTKQSTQVVQKGGTAKANAEAQSNLIVQDPLTFSVHSWPIGDNDQAKYEYKDGAYHITAKSGDHPAVALLPDVPLPDKFVYSLTFNEVNGTDDSTDANKVNLIGLMLRYQTTTNDGKNRTMFYTFLVNHTTKNGQYVFRKYDLTDGSQDDPWHQLWNGNIGDEYHLGHGKDNNNTIKVTVDGDKFTFKVNDKEVGSANDGSLKNGEIGMLVNLKDTEVAFSNLIVTHN